MMASPPVHIEWVAPAGCPSREEILGVVERIIGSSALRSAVDARVTVTQDEHEFHAEVTVSASGATSTRSLTGESCRAVGDAAALIVALAANPDANPAPPVATAPAPTPPPSIEPAATPANPELRRAPFLDASFFVDIGSLPSTGVGGELGVGWNPVHLDVEIVAAFLASQRATLLASNPSQGADLQFARVGARACYELFDARLDVGPCLGGGVEWIWATGFGSLPDQPANATGNMLVGSFGARAIGRLSSRVVLRLIVEASVPSTRLAFEIDRGGEVFHMSPVSVLGTAGAEAHF